MALAILQEMMQLLLQGSMGTPVFGGGVVTKYIEAYEGLSSPSMTDLGAQNVIATILCYCSEMIQDMIYMINGYGMKDLERSRDELKDAICHSDC